MTGLGHTFKTASDIIQSRLEKRSLPTGSPSLDGLLGGVEEGGFYLFYGGDPPPCLVAADRNDDGQVNLSDTVPCTGCEPPETCCIPPPNACGLNFTPDALTCESYVSC
ncbi:MAG: hypothetical protein QW390_01835 [Candidatus Bathyarchaeia archaeon]